MRSQPSVPCTASSANTLVIPTFLAYDEAMRYIAVITILVLAQAVAQPVILNGPPMEQLARDAGNTVKAGYQATAKAVGHGYEYTAEQLEALHKLLGDEGFYELFGGSDD